MFDNISVFTSDIYWKRIFVDLGMCLVDDVIMADVDFDSLQIKHPISLSELQQIVLDEANHDKMMIDIFHKHVLVSKLQKKILNALYKYGDLDIVSLKQYVGIDSSIMSHTVETAIYQLRKIYGHDLIYNHEGKYRLGHV